VSRIKAEIQQCMSGLERDGATIGARFLFPAGFIGFQGHFPGNSVLAGACQIQCALTALEQGLGKAVALGEIVLAKFVAPVLPEQEITCQLSDCADTPGEWLCRARITRGDERITELKLRVRLADGAGGRRDP
jgi:3-hydroxyacyl-[acyl-carrier-protein] dehydratase